MKIPLTATDKAVEITGWLALLTIWVLVISSYSNLPDTIPTHFNMAGKADGQSLESAVWFLPVMLFN
ncbi:MAG: DUF1648 domain-containing protein [Bacteroidales bacterium]|nr:DUF1648 domain-containing protein [Bacteroidales bacterium]